MEFGIGLMLKSESDIVPPVVEGSGGENLTLPHSDFGFNCLLTRIRVQIRLQDPK